MSGRKKDRQLFEILKTDESVEQPAPTVEQPRPEPEPQIQSEAPTSSQKPAEMVPPRTSGSRPMISLKQETFIFGTIVVILLIVFSFILGYSKGRNDAGVPGINETEEPAVSSSAASVSRPGSPVVKPAAVPKTIAQVRTEPAKPKEQIYTIRAWTGGKNAQNMSNEVVSFFQSNGLISWSVKDREGIKVFVGKFSSLSDPEAKRLRGQVREMLYKGTQSFKDCYFVKTEG